MYSIGIAGRVEAPLIALEPTGLVVTGFALS